jgi:hypothetical protein
MAQAVSRRPLTAEGQVRFRVNVREICGGQIGTGTGFSRSNSSACCFLRKRKRAKRGHLPNRNAVSKIGEHWTEKNFQFVGLESVKAVLVFQVVEKLSSVRGARRFIYVFTKAHLRFCPVSDVSWPQLVIMSFYLSVNMPPSTPISSNLALSFMFLCQTFACIYNIL